MAKCCVFLFIMAMLGIISGHMLISPPSRPCRELGFVAGSVSDGWPRLRYSAGQVMRVRAELEASTSGVFQFYLCPDGDDTEEQECLVRLPLKLGGDDVGVMNGEHTVFDLRLVPRAGQYTIPITLPENITCPACTLMMEVIEQDCGVGLGVGGEDCLVARSTACVDITIQEPRDEEFNTWRYLRELAIRR